MTKEFPKHLFITLIPFIFFLLVSYPLIFFLEKRLIFNIAMISTVGAMLFFCIFAILYFRFEMKKSFKNRRPFFTGIILTLFISGASIPLAVICHFTNYINFLLFIMAVIMSIVFYIILASLIISFFYNLLKEAISSRREKLTENPQ